MKRFLFVLVLTSLAVPLALADGMVRPPKMYKGEPYKGSLNESAQEAIIIFTPGTEKESAVQDLIIKIHVDGDVNQFGWVVPLCAAPSQTAKEDAELFNELHTYVQRRLAAQRRPMATADKSASDGSAAAAEQAEPVEVIERKIVGSFDVAIVKENKAGALNDWLSDNGYQPVDDAEDVMKFYRDKGYVYACVKVSDVELRKGRDVELHPLRFRFETGGRDGIFFPMRLTGLQEDRFDVNLHVFYRAWLNDRLNGFGYRHRGFDLRWRDYDSKACKPNAGKTWSDCAGDPYLRSYARYIPKTEELFQKLHPGQRFYLTNIHARGLKPDDVRHWPEDLWLFPYYTNRKFTPYDVREGGPAAALAPD